MMKWQAACAFLEDCHFQDARQEQVPLNTEWSNF